MEQNENLVTRLRAIINTAPDVETAADASHSATLPEPDQPALDVIPLTFSPENESVWQPADVGLTTDANVADIPAYRHLPIVPGNYVAPTRRATYADLVELRRSIACKRTQLIPLLRECEAFGLPALARESGFPVYTLRRLAGPKPKGPLTVPSISRVALCIRELKRYRHLLDLRAAVLDDMRDLVREERSKGKGWRRAERLLGAPSDKASGAFAIRLLRTQRTRQLPTVSINPDDHA
jgi:hypothetical protein